MDATELSEQIKVKWDAGEFAAAHRLLLDTWKQFSEFGLFHSDVPEYPDAWVQFKTHGYPFGLRAQWDATRSDKTVMEIVLRYIDSWNLAGIDSQPIALPENDRPIEIIDAIDESLIGWLIRVFVQFWRRDLTEPRKN